MARPLKPFIRGGGYYPSNKWTPLVYNGGYTTMNGGEEPEPPTPVYWKTITGASPLALAKALAHSIKSLTQYGLCTQSTTPTPSAPVDIMCNNGALRMVDDELPSGYKRVLGFQCDNNAMWEITGFKLKGSDTVRISFSINAACNVFGCYQGADADDNYDLYVSTTSGSKYFRYGSGTYLSYWSSSNLGQRFDVVYTPTGSQGMPQNSTWTPLTFTSANNLLIGSTTLTGTSAKLKGNLYGSIVVDGRLHLVPCERLSDNVLGYYDTVGEAFYEPYEGFDGAVSLGYDGSHYVLQTVGTPEVLTVSATGAETQTITNLPMLLSVNDYKDEGEIISGLLTHKVGIKVLDGTETIGTSNACFTIAISDRVASKTALLCSHFPYSTKTSAQTDDCTIISFSSTNIGFRYDACADKTAFAAFLAAQYAAGTPVIVVYPLAEETTDSVTPQTISTSEGDNVMIVTSNVDPVTLEVEYASSEEE